MCDHNILCIYFFSYIYDKEICLECKKTTFIPQYFFLLSVCIYFWYNFDNYIELMIRMNSCKELLVQVQQMLKGSFRYPGSKKQIVPFSE